MTKTYKLTTIEQVVDVAKTLSKSWFRGHSKVYGELTPKIYRKELEHIRHFREDIELYFIESFKRGAPVLAKNLPNQDDDISWLFLMQHHGTPTRLLDWTESALIALYFIVSGNKSSDGELWAMFPDALNQHSGFFGMPLRKNRVLRYLAAEPLHTNREELADELDLKVAPKYPLAILPPMNFSRMVSQLSAFTIHPKPDKNCTIPELLSDEKSLVRYIIPSSFKDKLLSDLAALGITQRTLFQDLDSLSISLTQEARIVGYGPPVPPNCDGEYDASEDL